MKIYVWPDGTWCDAEYYCEIKDAWRGDNYYTLDVPYDVSDIAAYISEHGQH